MYLSLESFSSLPSSCSSLTTCSSVRVFVSSVRIRRPCELNNVRRVRQRERRKAKRDLVSPCLWTRSQVRQSWLLIVQALFERKKKKVSAKLLNCTEPLKCNDRFTAPTIKRNGKLHFVHYSL